MSRISVALLGLASLCGWASAAPSYTFLVDPLIGTDGSGHTFPGATVPFGMVAPSPDNADRSRSAENAFSNAFASGYRFNAPRIQGFSNTHISGGGIPELGDVLLQPAFGTRTGGRARRLEDWSSRYDKSSEWAKPGYYAVTLTDLHAHVEVTATQRVALHRYTFPRPGVVQVLVDAQHGLSASTTPRVTASDVTVTGREVAGTVDSRNGVERRAAFVVRFDRAPFKAEKLPEREGDRAPRWVLSFYLQNSTQLQARVAMSTTDVEGARRNLAEADGRWFEVVMRDADRLWAQVLGRVRIEGTERTRRIFYTALYHALMHPSDIADVDGRYRSPSGEVAVARGGAYYSTLALWDTYRAVHPLITLVAPERVDGIVQTLIDHHRALGYLPLWTVWGREAYTLIGNPALPVIADALAKGFKGFDANEALAAMLTTSTTDRPNAPPWGALDLYGYFPFDIVAEGAVSKTLDAGIGDDAVARVAASLGRADLARAFAERAKSWRRLLDPQTGLMRGRDSKGAWREPFDPVAPHSALKDPGDTTESSAWQYSFTPALHDPQGLVDAMGGSRSFGAMLDRFFALRGRGADEDLGQEALIGSYAHSNEPSHHVAWLYAWTDTPWKGHDLLRRIAYDFYDIDPAGIPGNDDSGQMSAWYVFAVLGMYPVVPASGRFVLAAPQVPKADIHGPDGRVFRIRAPGSSPARPYAESAQLNGRSLPGFELSWADIRAGGELVFTMVPLPETSP